MNVVVCGCGRAGKVLIEYIMETDGYQLIGVICRDESDKVGRDVGEVISNDKYEVGIQITPLSHAEDEFKNKNVDVIIDFSNKVMAIPLIELCGRIKSNIVICTTNHSLEEIGKFEQVANNFKIGVVYAPNLTIGINLLLDFAKKLSRIFEGFNYEIIEKHPSNKPKPTATARIIAETVDQADVPIHSVRMEGYVGVHELIATDGIERLTLKHESLDRRAFAKGALVAAGFLKNKIGLFFMKDVIDELDV